MDRGMSAEEGRRQRELLQYTSVVESRRWWPTLKQKRILKGKWASGIRNPSEAEMDEITADLQQHGRAEAKNVYYWFRNESTRQKGARQQSGARNCDCSSPSNQLENMVSVEGEQEEAVPRTLDLFPLHPDRGGL